MPTNNISTKTSKVSTVSHDTILKVSKEIAIKFIEVGRLTPATFDKTFKDIHTTVKKTVEG